MMVFCIIDIFVFSGHPASSIVDTIIVVIAFVLEQIIESLQINQIVLTSTESAITNKAVFAYIDLYREIENINRGLIKSLAESQSGLFNHYDLTHKTCNYILKHIGSYVQWQTSECQKLLEERNKLEQSFSDLSSGAERLGAAFAQHEKKLNNSNKAFLYCEKGTALIEDINESFESRYKQTANEFIKHLESVEQQLRKVVTQYSQFKDFMRPYNEKVGVYGARMESTIQLLQKDSDSKRVILENTSNEISKILEDLNDGIEKTLSDADQFLRKNTFVLLKILETYKTDATTPRNLQKILQSWSTSFPVEGAKV
jgi:DNA repair exonuclease SbcCD ATPase subunit